MDYELVRRGIENRIVEIGNDLSKQRFKGELKDLMCHYRELKMFIKDDPIYETKRCLMGLFLISMMED